MTRYRLTAVEFRQVTSRNEKGDVTSVRRYRQGDVIDLTGSEEQRLLVAGALAPLETQSTEAAETGDDAGNPPTADPEAEKPKKAAAVDEWRDYAVGQGFDRAEVEDMTKAELIAAVG